MKYVFYIKDDNTKLIDSKIKEIDDDNIEKFKEKIGKSINGSTIIKIRAITDFNFNQVNPEVEPGDRVLIIYMQGESFDSTGGIEFGTTKGKVIKKIDQPKFSPTDPGYGYYVEWYNDEGKIISKLPLFPESDGWMYDRDYYESNPENVNESMFNSLDDLIRWGEFFELFSKGELEKVCEFLELERRTGFSNMYQEGGRFLLTGPKYITDFINLKSYEREFDEEDEELHKTFISRAQEVRDIFIRNAMKYLEKKDKELETKQIQSMMLKLARNAKEYWMKNANKFLNKEIL